MAVKKNKVKKYESKRAIQSQNANANIKIEFSPEIIIEVASMFPYKKDITSELNRANILLHNIYRKATFLISWSGTKLVGCLRYISTNYAFTEDEIIRVLMILENKRQRYEQQAINSDIEDHRLGYRRSIPRAGNYNGSPIIYISMHE